MPENNVNPKDSRKGAEPEIPVNNVVSVKKLWAMYDTGDCWLINNEVFGIHIPKFAGEKIANKIFNAIKHVDVLKR